MYRLQRNCSDGTPGETGSAVLQFSKLINDNLYNQPITCIPYVVYPLIYHPNIKTFNILVFVSISQIAKRTIQMYKFKLLA